MWSRWPRGRMLRRRWLARTSFGFRESYETAARESLRGAVLFWGHGRLGRLGGVRGDDAEVGDIVAFFEGGDGV